MDHLLTQNRSPRQTIKSTCSIYNSSFQNWKISHLKQLRQEKSDNKHDCVCINCLRYHIRPLLLAACVIVFLQSKFKESFLSGLKRKLFSLDGVRGHCFCQIMDINTKGKIAHLSYFRWAFFTHQRFSNGKDWSRVRSSFCWVWSQRSISVARTYPGIFGKFELIFCPPLSLILTRHQRSITIFL